jgi:3-oxoacyl-(acyl-carrier-protein) synthase
MSIYINAAQAISPQHTFDTQEFITTVAASENNYFSCIEPDYKNYISAKVLRRMSKMVKMSLTASLVALKNSNIETPDAIIFGTGLGCVDDTLKFLEQIIDNKELLLNPTAFMQSTHNTVAGQIALLLACKNYNFTFTQQSVSFETALIDAMLMLHEKENCNVLLGSVDEITEKSYDLLKMAGCVKSEPGMGGTNPSSGYTPGEGANCFVLSNTKSAKNKAKILGVSLFNKINTLEPLPVDLKNLFEKNGLSIRDIDVLISGVNGDENTDKNYLHVKKFFGNSIQLNYKQLIGEYDTASGFALWLAYQIIYNQYIPEIFKVDDLPKSTRNTILIHNYSIAHEHSFILVSKC